MTDSEPMHQPSSDAFGSALSLAADALGSSPAGLLTDLDGTLAPIVRDPAAVRLAPGADDALRSLARRLAVVGVVSGRAALDVRRLVAVPSLLIAGNHGVEWLEPGSSEPQFAPGLAGVPTALRQLLSAVPAIDGVTVDDKRLSATVHYRRTADPARARQSILHALTTALEASMAGDAGIELREGRMSIELRPREAGDKGSAVVTAVDRFALRGLVVLGDDLTDLDMFREAARLRDEGRLRAAIVAVGGHGEVPEQVFTAADAVLPDPASAVRLLAAL
jgi:trehalose 6-phosphate phosphatase